VAEIGPNQPKMAPESSEADIFPVEAPLGMYTVQMDDKGRVKLPVDFQTFFGSFPDKKMYVTSLDGITGQIYPISIWRRNQKFFARSRENTKAVERVMFNAQDLGSEAEMDSSGRITVCPAMRDELKLAGQQLRLVVVKGRVEILSEQVYQARRRAARPAEGEEVTEEKPRPQTENVRILEEMGLL
jgi:DNA-binding transcriptional regulator/RsmH inhibitor MraZ